MIYMGDSSFSFYSLGITFTDNGEQRHHYASSREQYDEMFKKFPRMGGLIVTPFSPSVEQEERLIVLNSLQAENKEAYLSSCTLFVEHGVILAGSPEFLLSIANQYESVTAEYLKKQLYKEYDAALLSHLDSVAQSRRYDNRISCALRAGFAGPFQAEGAAFATWMDECNAYSYNILAEVEAGNRLPPATAGDYIAELPVIVWPA